MGACIGKKSTKYLKHKQPPSNVMEVSQPEAQVSDDALGKKSPPSSPKKLPVTDGFQGDDNDYRLSKIDGDSINSELQVILDEQKIIHDTLSQPFPSRIISVTDTELEYELAILMFEHPEDQSVDNTPTADSKNA